MNKMCPVSLAETVLLLSAVLTLHGLKPFPQVYLSFLFLPFPPFSTEHLTAKNSEKTHWQLL